MIVQDLDNRESSGVVTAAQLAERTRGIAVALKALTAIRAFGVTVGPSLVFDLFLAGAAIETARGRLIHAPRNTRERDLRILTILGDTVLAAYALFFRPWMQRWGATDVEKRKGLPGDELVLNPWKESTRAITVKAPVEDVWPWVAQIGQDRGGFYSYEWLENLAGCRITNADRLHPEWQDRQMGEVVKLHPATGCTVARFEPGYAIVLNGWGAFVVEPKGPRASRVIVRTRTAGLRSSLFDLLLLELPHFVMERRMLKGIKRRAESGGGRRAHQLSGY